LQQQHINSNKRNAAYGEINTRLIAEEEAEETANAVPMSETFNSESNITFSELKIAQEIGTGNYGKVNLGSWKGSQVALKRSKAFERTEFVREAKLVMSMPPHQNLVQTFGLTNDGFNLMLVMEYCNGGSLDVKLFDLPDPVSDKEKLSILIGIAQGMQHLHQNKIIHRDLAARNILLNNNVPKVSDFGLSRKVDDILRNSTTRNNVGPIRWMAPEALRDGTYSAKTDVWSFGIVMFEVITQSEPHVEEDPLFIGIKIRDGAIFPRLPAASDQGLKTLMEQCCRKEPNERPDFNNICHVLVSRWNELNGPN
jgi:serine/threonine protein kinase